MQRKKMTSRIPVFALIGFLAVPTICSAGFLGKIVHEVGNGVRDVGKAVGDGVTHATNEAGKAVGGDAGKVVAGAGKAAGDITTTTTAAAGQVTQEVAAPVADAAGDVLAVVAVGLAKNPPTATNNGEATPQAEESSPSNDENEDEDVNDSDDDDAEDEMLSSLNGRDSDSRRDQIRDFEDSDGRDLGGMSITTDEAYRQEITDGATEVMDEKGRDLEITSEHRENGVAHRERGAIDYRSKDVDSATRHDDARAVSERLGSDHTVIVEEVVGPDVPTMDPLYQVDTAYKDGVEGNTKVKLSGETTGSATHTHVQKDKAQQKK